MSHRRHISFYTFDTMLVTLLITQILFVFVTKIKRKTNENNLNCPIYLFVRSISCLRVVCAPSIRILARNLDKPLVLDLICALYDNSYERRR